MGALRIFRRNQEKLGKAKRVEHLIRNCHWSERKTKIAKVIDAWKNGILNGKEFESKLYALQNEKLTIKNWMLDKSWKGGIVVEWVKVK